MRIGSVCVLSASVATLLLGIPVYGDDLSVIVGGENVYSNQTTVFSKHYGRSRPSMDPSDTSWMSLGLNEYDLVECGHGSNIVTRLNANDMYGDDDDRQWLSDNLQKSQLLISGTFNVPAGLSGTWNVRAWFDDYFAFIVDGVDRVVCSSYDNESTGAFYIGSGWHRFKIICGDTYGGYGANHEFSDYGVGRCPMIVTVNGNTFSFTDGKTLEFGNADVNVALSESSDMESTIKYTGGGGVLYLSTGTGLNFTNILIEAQSVAAIECTDSSGGWLLRDHYNSRPLKELYSLLDGISIGSNIGLQCGDELFSFGDGFFNNVTIGDRLDSSFYAERSNILVDQGIMGIGGTHRGGLYLYSGSSMRMSPGTELRVGNTGLGELYLMGGDLTVGEWMSIGRESGGNGMVMVADDGSLSITNATRPLWIGGSDRSSGHLSLTENSVVNVAGSVLLGGNLGRFATTTASVDVALGGALIIGGDFRAAENWGGMNTFFDVAINNGIIDVAGDVNLPSFRGYGTVEISAGTLRSDGPMFFGCGNHRNENSPSVCLVNVMGSGIIDCGNGGGEISLGTHAGGSGTLVLSGGTVKAGKISGSSEEGTFSRLELNGGSLIASEIENVHEIHFGPVTNNLFDKGFSGVQLSSADPGSVLSVGDFTFQGPFPPVDRVDVLSNKNMFELPHGSFDNTGMGIAHRWSFGGSLFDSAVGSEYGAIYGDGYAWTSDDELFLPGGAKGTCYMYVPAGCVPKKSFTIEAWFTPMEETEWTKLFIVGDIIVFNTRRDALYNNNLNFDSFGEAQVAYGNSTLSKGIQYYVSASYRPVGGGKDGYVVTQVVVDSSSGSVVWKCVYTEKDVDYVQSEDAGLWIGISNGNDRDLMAKLNEFRIWEGPLPEEAMMKSVLIGPNATAEDVDEIASIARKEYRNGRTLAISGDASELVVTVYGGSFVQPILDLTGLSDSRNPPSLMQDGTGRIKIVDRVVVNHSSCMKFGGTIDLSDAKLEIVDPENLGNKYNFITPFDDMACTVLGTPELVNFPKGYEFRKAADGTCQVVKKVPLVIRIR